MPSNRRRVKRESQKESWKDEYCLFGHVLRPDGTKSPKPYLFMPEYNGPFCDHFEAYWLEHREELMARWTAEHPGGDLPWAERDD